MLTSVETFERIIRHQSEQELIPFLLRLDKKDVVPVRAKAQSLHKELDEYRLRANGHWTRLMQPQQEVMLFLAGLATYSRKEALARGFELPWQFTRYGQQLFEHRQSLLTVLEHARPNWLSDWAERVARANSWQLPDYQLLRELEKRELLEFRPWLFGWTLAQWLGLQSWRIDPQKDISFQAFTQGILHELQADAVLLHRDIPLLFDFDTTVDWSELRSQRPAGSINWEQLLAQLVASGHLDRADLLTRCLLALRRDFRRPLLTWFKTLFLALQPTVAERLARQNELVELLAHPLPLVVNFALDQLKDLWTEPDFAPAPLLLYAEGLMTRQDLKTGLRGLLSTFEKLLKREPSHAPTVARLATSALANADAAVQERAAKLLAGLLSAKKPVLTADEAAETTGTIGLYADLLASAARAVLTPFLTAGFTTDQVETALESYAPVLGFMPDLSPATAIAPVQDWHELLFLTGEMLQHNNPGAFERWLDGLLRLRGQFPADYPEQLMPYLKQVFQWELRDKSAAETFSILTNYQFGDRRNGRRELVYALLISWYSRFAHPKVAQVSLADQQYSYPDPLLRVEQRRFAAAEQTMRGAAAPLPLLSTPSHAPHWVAPTVLVQKLLAYQAASQQPDAADFALALARTAVRAEADVAQALAVLPQLQHEGIRALLQQAFGSETAAPEEAVSVANPAGKSVLKTLAEGFSRLLSPKQSQATTGPISLAESLPWLRAVAARTRQPEAVLENLRPLSDYPGIAEPWQPGWHFEEKSHTYKQSWNKKQPEVTNVWQELTVPTTHQGQVPPSPLLLYSLHARLPQANNYYLWSLGSDLPFLLSLLPNNPAPLHWHLLRTACRTDDMGAEARDLMLTFLRSLLVPGPRFEASTSVLLAVGLTHFAPTCRALALEVFLNAVTTGRLVPAALGEALGRVLAAGFIPAQRLADGLAQARAISPATDDALRQTLAALLPELPLEPLRNLRKLLEAYADVLGRTGQAASAAVQARLRDWQTVGSLKKVISPLLA